MSTPAHSVPSPPILASHTSSTSTITGRPNVSSPLNPSPPSTPPPKPSSILPSIDSSATLSASLPLFRRPRGHSTSTIRNNSPPSTSLLTRVTSHPVNPTDYDDVPTSSFRFRSLSPSRSRSKSPIRGVTGSRTPPHGVPSTWWNGGEIVPRPWRDTKRKKTVPSEQTEGWVHTRERVAKAAVSVLGTAGDVAHEVLLLSVDVLEFVPVIGLQEAARTLLNIWDSLQQVDMNRLACLRLTERCADILLSVREEIHEAGDEVGEELRMPITKLVESFTQVHVFLQRQIHRPFLKRYLKRDEILRQIADCDASLGNSLGMFSLSIQIRILKQVQAAELRRQADTQALLSSLVASHVIDPQLPTQLVPASHHLTDIPHTPSAILGTLRELHTAQNSVDRAADTADLRGLMRAALQTSNDAEMIEVLQVGREEMPEAVKTLQRALERVGTTTAAVEEGMLVRRESVKTVASTGSGSRSGGSEEERIRGRDTLDREFIETGIDALRRMSRGVEESLPSWTITRYEVDREEKIGIGFFSDVYRGVWRGRTVAIKVLAPTTPRELFVREVGIWTGLRHAHVLELYGASSASGDPPWFFVSPYLKNGSLAEYLRGVREGRGGSGSRERKGSRVGGSGKGDVDLLKMMHEVAKGMEYLHARGVLHGDLKAANVLVDDRVRCVISDFGQSEMKSEAYRISGTTPPHGTLRWQAPELMAGQDRLTTEMDVYAYAICCVEILTMGRLPWPLMDDDAVRHFVLKDNARPPLPHMSINTPGLQELLRVCWDRDPFVRPSFSKVVRDVKQLRLGAGSSVEEITSPRLPDLVEDDHERSRPSPDMHPIPLPAAGSPPTLDPGVLHGGSPQSSDAASFRTARELSNSPPAPVPAWRHPHREDTVATPRVHVPEPVLYTPSGSSSSASSIFASEPSTRSDENVNLVDYEGYDSPPPADERIAEMRNERRYRLLLGHEFHPSLTLPLWTPVPVTLGAVGYLSKPSGAFVTLFNSFDPPKSSDGIVKGMPSLYGYGRVTTGNLRSDKRNAAQRGLDAIAGFLTFKNKGDGSISQNVSRRYSFPLRAGHKSAYLCTETTMYRYMENLEAPKKWFKANIDSIMDIYGSKHRIQREDVFLVIGTLDAPDYALFVSHNHPDGQGHFNVFSSAKAAQPWGTFTTDTEFPPELGGPSYHETVDHALSASKVSTAGGPWDTVLIARLRFKPDVAEPTSL